MKRLNKQFGISLVEVLVALVISLFLLAGIVQVYSGNKATFTFTNALAEIQENGRFAIDTMTQDLRLSGEWGCIEFDSDDTDNINNEISAANGMPSYDPDFHDFVGEEAIEGTDGVTDTIIVRGGRPGQANVESPFEAAGTNQLMITSSGNFGANDVILVARCGANDLLIAAEADLLRVVSNTPNGAKNLLQIAGNKSQQFEKDAMVIELQTVTYSILPGLSGQPALFRQEFGGAPQEMVEGVEDMQILYGVDADTDGFPDQYMPANLVADFEEVVAVRVQLLLQSMNDFVADVPQTYTFNGATVTPGDRRIRQIFTSTIALRNRIGSS